jgi:trehalose 6-phosphate synthase
VVYFTRKDAIHVHTTNGASHLAQNDPLQGCRVLVVSNRGPAQFHQRSDGRSVPSMASGGLATAMVAAAKSAELSWIAVAGNEADRKAFADRDHRIIRINDVTLTARYVPVSDKVYRLHYDDTSNRTLWFLQHYLLQSEISPSFGATDRRAWNEGYVPVNRAVADAVIDELTNLDDEERERTIVLLQDYHLYLAPGMIRAALPTVKMGHFTHIPWPSARNWQFLPQQFTQAIIQSMIQNDIVGLQTPLDVENFALCAKHFLSGASCTSEGSNLVIRWNGNTVRVHAYPISIDPEHVLNVASGPLAQRAAASLNRNIGERQVVLRVDRLEPTKNIVRGLQAFDLMLEQHPDLVGKVRFLQMLVPSREGVTRYRRYARQVTKLAQKINEKYHDRDEEVVITINGNNYARALAAMRKFDVMLVNSILDGMHLGAKEGAVVNDNDGVLVVSRTAGVYHDLKDGACLGISPLDIEETADMLYKALVEMTPSERRKMGKEAYRRVISHSVSEWLADQLLDILDATPVSAPAVPLPFVTSEIAADIIEWEPYAELEPVFVEAGLN